MPEDIVDVARSLRDTILAARNDTESQRQLPEPVVAALRASKLGRMALQTELDGLETDPLTALDVFEELAAAEASVSWIVWNSSLPCHFGRNLSDEARARLLGNPDHLFASSTRPTGKAVPENGGYRVSGRWSLVSGCRHADVFFFMCLVEEDGQVLMAQPGAPDLRVMYVPRSACKIVDTWHVGGLRGTGSHDVVLDGVAVPEEHQCSPFWPSRVESPLGRIPVACTMSAGHAAICLGIARAALEAAQELGRTKVTVDPTPDMRDRLSNQRIVAEAATKIAGMRGRLRETVGTLWEKAESGSSSSLDEIGDTWSAAVTTIRCCKSAITELYEAAGTSSLYTDCPIERAHRDIHAAAQHVVAQPLWLEQAGAVKLGLEPTNPLFAA